MTTGPTAARAGPWRIGALAALTGATPKALRLYETEGLLPAPRRQGTYRVYDALHLGTARLIRTAQAAGFSLRELKSLAGQARLVDGVPLGLARDAEGLGVPGGPGVPRRQSALHCRLSGSPHAADR